MIDFLANRVPLILDKCHTPCMWMNREWNTSYLRDSHRRAVGDGLPATFAAGKNSVFGVNGRWRRDPRVVTVEDAGFGCEEATANGKLPSSLKKCDMFSGLGVEGTMGESGLPPCDSCNHKLMIWLVYWLGKFTLLLGSHRFGAQVPYDDHIDNRTHTKDKDSSSMTHPHQLYKW